ncbi:sulfite exporter TauE/SafE family protein [Halegenticoccus soli]|uniref:sulfite exporter TauE/SafE family protein n=1 Tax=Halegenticoccus soli TaxID=1985678 RepID=UPI000C6E1132|nr:sulfite exporter TauE/SafE family protein [Halegenticoccus soli]
MGLFELSATLTALFVVFGLTVGILFGFFGMGGSFFVTPALLVLGHSAPTAVGTGLAFVFWTSFVATLTHRDLDHIDYRLGLLLIIGMTAGIELGKRALLVLAAAGLADLVVSLLYVVLLAAVGLFVVRDGRHPAIDDEGPRADQPSLASVLERVRVPPLTTLSGGIDVSIWVVLSIATLVGSLFGFLGVGGGFLMVPSLVYGLAVPGAVAIGTDIFQITVSSAYGVFVYGQQRAIHFAMLLLGSVSVASKTISHAYGIEPLHTLSLTLLLGGALAISMMTLYLGLRNRREEPI